MRVPVLHLVLHLDEGRTLRVLKLVVRPATVRVASVTETRLRLKGTIAQFLTDLTLEDALIDSLELEFLLLRWLDKA